MKTTIMTTLATVIIALPVSAKPSLWSYPKIDQGLFDVGVAYGIKSNCTSIVEHKIRAATFAWSLVNYARGKGYSTQEVRQFIDSPVEKAALRARVTKYLKGKGLDPQTPNALCSMGKTEIAKGTQVGKLLRPK